MLRIPGFPERLSVITQDLEEGHLEQEQPLSGIQRFPERLSVVKQNLEEGRLEQYRPFAAYRLTGEEFLKFAAWNWDNNVTKIWLDSGAKS